MNQVTFEAYWPLAGLALLPLIWWASVRSRATLSALHLGVATFLRTVGLVLIVLALMQPVWTTGSNAVSVVYALDVSRSIGGGFIQSALGFIAEANRNGAPEQARYLVFAEQARMVERPQNVTEIAVTDARDGDPQGLYQGATDLELALDEALLGFAPDSVKRLVLFSDGNQTRGDVWRVVPRLQAQGVRVFTFPAPPRAARDAWVEALDLPDLIRRDERIAATVRVVSNSRSNARVRLSADGKELASRSVVLVEGINILPMRLRIRAQGLVALTAVVEIDGDEVAANNRLRRSAWVGPRPRVLYVEGAAESARFLRDALARAGLDVVTAGAAQLPADPRELGKYNAVIISDVPGNALDVARMSALEGYVRDGGGGLIFAAGENTYGQSGFSNSALERVLPVEFKAQEKRKDLALVVCIDRSYSMKGRPMDLAKAGARAALALLEEQHRFGVVAFDSQPHEAVPLQYVRSKRKAEDLVDRIQASGQTNIYPALATTWRMLQNLDSKRKHVILLSDGDTAPADFERLLKRMTDASITVSTVTIGRSGDPELMARIARWGRGKAYVADDVAQVPQIFVEDTQNVARATLIEESFKPVLQRKIEALRGLDFSLAPPLLGFASTKAKDGAEVFLATAAGAPVLARWQYGLGKTVVFTSDVKNRWAAGWLGWEGYGQFWAQLVRDTMRRDTGEEVLFQVARTGDQALLQLRLMTREGGWQNRLAPQVRVTRPDGSAEVVPLHQTGPGHYKSAVAVATAADRPFTFELANTGGVSKDIVRRAGVQQLHYPYPDEYRSFPPDMALLAALAEQTGGKVAPSAAEIFDAQGDRGSSRTPLWPWLASLALVAYLCDIAVRRAPWFRRMLEPAPAP